MHDASAPPFGIVPLLLAAVVSSVLGPACGPSAVQTDLLIGGSIRTLHGQSARGGVERTDMVLWASVRLDERVAIGQLDVAPEAAARTVDSAALPCVSAHLCRWERREVGRALAKAWRDR